MAKSQEVIGDCWGMLRLQLCIDESKHIHEKNCYKLPIYILSQAMTYPLKGSTLVVGGMVVVLLFKEILPVSRLNIDSNRTTHSVPPPGLLHQDVHYNVKQINI